MCYSLVAGTLKDLNKNYLNKWRGSRTQKIRKAKDKRETYKVQQRFIAAAKVERVACASVVASQQLRLLVVHVFNGYVASLSAILFSYIHFDLVKERS